VDLVAGGHTPVALGYRRTYSAPTAESISIRKNRRVNNIGFAYVGVHVG